LFERVVVFGDEIVFSLECLLQRLGVIYGIWIGSTCHHNNTIHAIGATTHDELVYDSSKSDDSTNDDYQAQDKFPI